MSEVASSRLRTAAALSAMAIAKAEKEASRSFQDDDRISKLEREIESLSADLLELLAAVPVRPAAARTPGAAFSTEAKVVRDLFAAIVERRSGVPSLVTVVVPVYGKLDYTLRCLRSIASSWSPTINPTIVVIDDASPDESVHELLAIPGIDVIRNGANLGYLRSSNRGAAIASTPYVCFLNNDTEVANAWLDTLVIAAETDTTIGAVGSKLVYPDGTLQEAGGIIWSDASGWNFGRGDDPAKSEYNVARDVDYCSAASLLVRTDLLKAIGGFDERYAPAYYEDADLCFEIRARGYRVVYEPASQIIHYEGVSSGTDTASGVKRYQDVNRPKFAEKWQGVLATHLAPSAANVERAVYGREARKTILIVDSYVPMHDREAGSNRLFKIVQLLRDLDYYVIFFPANGSPIEPYSSDLARLGVEIVYMRTGFADDLELVASVLRRIDVAWICRPELCVRYLPVVRRGKVPIIYDTIDLHFAREKRRFELEGGDGALWRAFQETEVAMAHAADIVVTVTEAERAELAELDITNVAVIPTIHDVEPHEHFSYDVRTGVVFIGGYGHTPNVDAAVWLCSQIMPIVWRTLPDLRVTLLGNQPPQAVLALRSDRVTVTGFIADVGPFFEESRVFVAPLRYGAGMKGKVGHALSYGLPVVTTSIGADGYALENRRNCLIADDTASFASAIVEMYGDRHLWEQCSLAGSDVIEAVGRDAVRAKLAVLLDDLGVCEPRLRSERTPVQAALTEQAGVHP